jgi:hypothetical protein
MTLALSRHGGHRGHHELSCIGPKLNHVGHLRRGGGGGAGGKSPPSLSPTKDSSSLLRIRNLFLGGMTLRNHIEVSLQCESERDAT